LVKEGKFRDDLFFRLNVVPIELPPLRVRKEDIPLLVRAFVKQSADENGKSVQELTADAMQAVLRYDWPGNVRELRTAVEHGVVMATGPKVTLRDLPGPVRAAGGLGGPALPRFAPPKEMALDVHANEEALILQALDATKGNISKAALKLGISRRTLHRKLKEIRGRQKTDDASTPSASASDSVLTPSVDQPVAGGSSPSENVVQPTRFPGASDAGPV
jgi:two-component system, NtrC family, response regulator AtoC